MCEAKSGGRWRVAFSRSRVQIHRSIHAPSSLSLPQSLSFPSPPRQCPPSPPGLSLVLTSGTGTATLVLSSFHPSVTYAEMSAFARDFSYLYIYRGKSWRRCTIATVAGTVVVIVAVVAVAVAVAMTVAMISGSGSGSCSSSR